jgi:hypothetical protein
MESAAYADSTVRRQSLRTKINNGKPMQIVHNDQIEARGDSCYGFVKGWLLMRLI